MRSIVAMGKGGRPLLLAGAKGWIKPVNSGGGEGGLFHKHITLESGVTVTFTEVP